MLDAGKLIPHQTPFCFLDKVLAHTDGSIVCSAPVTLAQPFVRPQGLPAHFGMEILAQASAAFFTLSTGGDAPLQGMLVACQKYVTTQTHYSPNATLLALVTLASPLPGSTGALVKFTGELRQTSMRLADIDEHTIVSLPVLSSASLSVYI